MSLLKEEANDLAPIVVDLNAASNGMINESFLAMFGGAMKTIMKRMFGGGSSVPVQIKGTKAQVSSLTKAISSEKNYLDSWRRFGLDDPKTYRNKGKLDAAIKNFERQTKIKWPFN